jgi:thiol:disulfide interchange protein DsbD
MHWKSSYGMRCATLLVAVVGFLLHASPALALDEDKPFAVSAPKRVQPIHPGEAGELSVGYQVFKDHFIYRDMSSITVVDAGGLEIGPANFPVGTRKFDTISSRDREIFSSDFTVVVPVAVPPSAKPGKRTVRLLVKWQGCNLPKNYCLFPAKEEIEVAIKVLGARTAPRAGPPEDSAAAGAPPRPGKAPQVSFKELAASAVFQEIDPEGKKHPVLARMFADSESVQAGSSFRLAVHLQQKEGWHTYWKSPGDIGLPTRIEWSLPETWQAAPFEFPIPVRFDQDGIISYGYEDQVVFFSEVSVPADVQPGNVQVEARVNWLVCEISCIPGEAKLRLPLKVVAAGSQVAAPSPYLPLIDHFAKQHPVHPTSIADFAVEASLSVSGVKQEQPFQVAIRVTPTSDSKVAVPASAGTWPGFAPIIKLTGMLMESSISAQEDGSFLITMEAETFEAEGDLPTGERIGGLLQVRVGDEWLRTEVSLPVPWLTADQEVLQSSSTLFAPVGDAPQAAAVTPPSGAADAPAMVPTTAGQFLWMLLLAFVGGMLLNIMPCVLPVLTMKLYSLVEQKDVSAAQRRVAGLAYSAGIVCSFLVLAAAVVVLRLSFGQDVLWGFQFQYPAYVAALAAIVWLFGLSLFGVFEVPALGANQAADASAGEGTTGYFLTGVFATLLATPCSAPFLGTGMGFAFSLPTAGILLFFAAAGLGLAFPFLIIAVVPALFRFLPRPGAWMDTFKQLMGFTLVATTLWLVDVLIGQVGADGGVGFLATLLFVAMGAWIFGRWGGPTQSGARQLGAFAMAVAVSALGALWFLDLEPAPDLQPEGQALVTELDFSEEMPWQAFSEERLEQLDGTLVFVDFTADWCLTCKVNEKTILATAAVREGMAELGVVPLKADWTRRDEVITRWLRRYGKAGVPFYLVIPADRSLPNIALPEVITTGTVLDALRRAAG